MIRIDLCNGKYTIIEDVENGIFKALRYGEEWRDLTGDSPILFLVYEIDKLRKEIEQLKLTQQTKNKNVEMNIHNNFANDKENKLDVKTLETIITKLDRLIAFEKDKKDMQYISGLNLALQLVTDMLLDELGEIIY